MLFIHVQKNKWSSCQTAAYPCAADSTLAFYLYRIVFFAIFMFSTCFIYPAWSAKSICIKSLQDIGDPDTQPLPTNQLTSYPRTGSKEFNLLVEAVQQQLKLNKSYAIINLNPYLDPSTPQYWFNMSRDRTPYVIRGSKVYYPNDGQYSKESAADWQIQNLNDFNVFMKKIIRHSITENIPRTQKTDNQARVSFEGSSGGSKSIFSHVDGGLASALMAPYGPGPEIVGMAPIGWSELRYHSPNESDWEKFTKIFTPITVETGHAIIFLAVKPGQSAFFGHSFTEHLAVLATEYFM